MVPEHANVIHADGRSRAAFAMGCFWGVERLFRRIGIEDVVVGYCGGYTPNPDYREVCGGCSGHAEAVLLRYDPQRFDYDLLLRTFWEGHDPTQGMRQGNDHGSQYRSVIYTTTAAQQRLAAASALLYEDALAAAQFPGRIRTTIEPLGVFTAAEPEHQRYLQRNPGGYCGLAGTGVKFPSAPPQAALRSR